VNQSATAKSKKSGLFWVYVLVALVVAVFGFIYYCFKTKVVGYEFNPNTWQVRHFEFFADPLTNFQLIGVDHTGGTAISIDPAVLAHIKLSSLPSADRWDLVELEDFHKSVSFGPAAIVVDLLTTHNSGSFSGANEHWSNWTTSNPKLAPAFWAAAQLLTIHGAYSALPSLFEITDLKSEDFDTALNSVMEKALQDRSEQLAASGDSQASRVAAADGLKFAPENQKLQKLAGDSTTDAPQ
jgi:hypothetical protein